MTDRHYTRRADAVIRLAGMVLCGSGGASLAELVALRPVAPEPVGYGLATITVVGASLGSGLLVLGHHIFDDVGTDRRWRPAAPAASATPSC